MRKIYHFKGDAAHPQMEVTYVATARQKLNRIKRILLKYLSNGNSN